jgi:hypothetical protein
MPKPFYNANNPEHFSLRNQFDTEVSSGNYLYDALGYPVTMTDASGMFSRILIRLQ